MKYVIYNCTEFPSGGLADRLKGLISCYGLAKKVNAEFIINWKYPFGLDGFLSPNKVNWKPRPIQGTLRQIYAMDYDAFNMHKEIFSNPEQIQEDILSVRTNINFLNNFKYSFKDCFEELFSIDSRIEPSAPGTIGLSCRFGGEQSDWQDIDFDKKISFDYVYTKIIKIAEENNCNKFFICSDSSKFLAFCTQKGLKFRTSIGNPMHIDYPGCNMEGYTKAFQDFLMLRQCDPICYIKGGFATTAAISNDRKAIHIE